MQYFLSGLTSGAIYALVGLGFAIIYNASHVINFAQGEFVMIGGMATAFLVAAGVPLWIAIPLAAAAAALVGVLVARFAIQPARGASVVTLIIITIGASIFLRGLAQIVFDKRLHSLPAFSGDQPIALMGATMTPQMLWVLGASMIIVIVLQYFFTRTMAGKAMLATSFNRLGAQLVGINVHYVVLASFALSATLGAVGGILVTPITSTNYEVGIMLGLKGFSAAILGGLGSGYGAIVGGLVLGLLEAFGAAYLSSAYKDALAFVVILLVLFFLPHGLFGRRGTDRV